jgi:hypothetical protein
MNDTTVTLASLADSPGLADSLSREEAETLLEALGELRGRLRRRLECLATPTPTTPPPPPIRWLTPDQVAERLGVTVRYVRNHWRDLGGQKLSERKVRFDERRFEKAMRTLP